MSLIVKNYNLVSNKIKKDVTICLITDIHFGKVINKNALDEVINSIQKEKPDYICISGDYIDCINILDDKVIYNMTITYLKELSKITKVIYTFGNHDIVKKGQNNSRIRSIPYNWLNDISKIKNLVILNNKYYHDNNISFIGYVPEENYYTRFYEKQGILIHDYPKKINGVNNQEYNILLFHSPVHIFKNTTFKLIPELSKIDLILSGHMHNGLVPNFIDRIWKSNRGLVSPYKRFFPKYARGIETKKTNDKEISLIVSGGITKVHGLAPKLFRFLKYFYKPEINYITIKKK